MSLTSGFFNSSNHDRLYNAEQLSAIFDGIITDGVFATVGSGLMVNAQSGMNITVGTGRAWFNHTWTKVDAIYPLEVDDAELILNRIDAVVLEVNHSSEVRANTIKIVKGTPASAPTRPTLVKDSILGIYQYPLAYIRVNTGTLAITQSMITNMIGTSDTPFVLGAVDSLDATQLIAQWETIWAEAMDNKLAEFEAWFDAMKDQLSEDAAGHLQAEIDDINDSIEGINGDINNIDGDIDDINSDISGVRSDISTINGNISTINSDISGIKTDVNGVKNSITSINGSINTINGNINTINGKITTINNNITTINNSINAINTRVPYTLKVISQSQYNSMSTPRPSNTLYFTY